ncbi:M56 family metallopeptidase [Luteibacter sp. NPDC031894]|uniref:M56 family metallopeptidase n=1 Tax=Luteibacter sp. NPDC031894 TaxID=3390572 RepID=UPI003CFD70A2
MLAWMVYAMLVAFALSAAALLAEQATRHRRWPTRWPWMVSLAASILLPIAMATISTPRHDVAGPVDLAATTVSTALLTLHDKTSIPLASRVIDWSGAKSYTSSTRINMILVDIWLASSFTLVLFLALSTIVFHRRKRRWAPRILCGEPVLVSEGVGPAVVGLIRSRIVVPAWVLTEAPEQQQFVMAHERSHVEARDPLLVAAAMAFLVSMPWNPLLWWQFHRLRYAIEVDCDARVLGEGGDVSDYCETLIHVGQNQSEYVGAVTAMSESKSLLERRIKIMLSKPKKWAGALAFALISVALGMAIFAAQVTPPADTQQPAEHPVATDPSLLDTYTGFYALSDYSLVTVARKGSGLTVTPIGQLLAQGTIDVAAISDTEFSIPSIDITLEFIKDAGGQAKSLRVREHGRVVMEAPRVDPATAEQIREGLAARVKDQKPFPDSEKALRQILSHPDTGGAAKLGPVESYRFEGVTDYGWDIYDVQYQHGAQQVFVQLDKHGSLTNFVLRRQ